MKYLSLLKPGRSCIITDVEERAFKRKGEQTLKKNLIYCDLPQGSVTVDWNWNFDSRGEYYPNSKTVLSVKAIQL